MILIIIWVNWQRDMGCSPLVTQAQLAFCSGVIQVFLHNHLCGKIQSGFYKEKVHSSYTTTAQCFNNVFLIIISNAVFWHKTLQLGLCIVKNIAIQYVSRYRGYDSKFCDILRYFKQGDILLFFFFNSCNLS